MQGQWDALHAGHEGDAVPSVHVKSALFCSRSGPLRHQMLDFLNGRSLDDLAELQIEVAKFSPTSVEERGIEGRHGQQKQELKKAPNISAPRFSLAGRACLLDARLKSDPDFLKTFAQMMSGVYHPIQVAHHLGLASHPLLVQAWGGQVKLQSTKKHDKVAKEVVYRLDSHSQFMEMQVSRSKPSNAKQPSDTMGDDIFPKLLERYAAEHFRQNADRNKFYSIAKKNSGNLGGKSFSGLIDQTICHGGDDFSADEGLGGSASSGEICLPEVDDIWFRPMMLRPALKKIVRSDIASPFVSSDIAVTVHPACHFERASNQVQVSLTSPGGGSDPDIALLEPVSWIELREWKQQCGLRCHLLTALADVPQKDVQDVVSKMFDEGAFEGSAQYYLPRDSTGCAVLPKLTLLGFVIDCHRCNGDLLGWQLTKFGLQNASFSVQLHSPSWFYESPTANWSNDWTTLNALVALRDEEWKVERWTRERERPAPLSLAGAIVKIFYIGRSAVTVGDKYVAVMARLMDKSWIRTLKANEIESVFHLADAGYYAALLSDNFDRVRQFDMVDDHGLGGADLDQIVKRKGRTKRPPKFRLMESFTWGKVSFKYKAPKTSRSKADLQVDCPRKSHIRYLKDGKRTMCCYTVGFKTESEQEMAIIRLKTWVVACKEYDSWQKHYKHTFPDILPTAEALEDLKISPDDPDTADEDIPDKPIRRRRARKKACARPLGKGDAASSTAAAGASSTSSSSSSSSEAESASDRRSNSGSSDNDLD